MVTQFFEKNSYIGESFQDYSLMQHFEADFP